MDTYWAPQVVFNPNLVEDLQSYFFNDMNKDEIENIITNNKIKLAVICDRYEFVDHLLCLKEIFISKRKYVNIKIGKEIIDEKSVITFSKDEEIVFDAINFNGITYDIDALCQYLLLTIVDTIMGDIDHQKFYNWLVSNYREDSYSIERLKILQDQYDDENGLRKNFRKAFSQGVSAELQQRIIDTFLIAKVDLGVVNPENLAVWNGLSSECQYNKITTYLYDSIRCKYTHSSSRTFLSDSNVSIRQPTKVKTLIAKRSPVEDNLIEILKAVIKDLVVSKFIKNII